MATPTAITQLQQDPANANRGTVRGRGMLERSLQQYGAGRAPVASADGVILAGNKTIEVAQELGIPIQEIESDGTTLYVIKRTDLPYDDPRARELAIADNRTGETGLDWDADILQSFLDDGLNLEQFWFDEELDRVLDAGDAFLDSALGAGDGSSPWPGGDDGGDPNTLTLKVTPEERDTIMRAVREARARHDLPTTPAALVAICEEWRQCRSAS